jgi:DNA polymerase II large subunit
VSSYPERIKQEVDRLYRIAAEARAKGYDPELFPEIPQAGDLSDRVEQLVGPKGVARAIRELELQMREFESEVTREELAFKIAEMIVDGRFGYMEKEKAAEQAVRTALAILTEGIVVAPLEGVTAVKIKHNYEDLQRRKFGASQYLALYLASPIRAAGGTAAALSILIADFVRRKLHLDPYKPTEEEVERYVEEVELYKTTVAPGQYVPTADEVRKLIWNLPVEVTGDPSDPPTEINAYRNLERVEHNYLRGGAILALVEGLLQKIPKVMKYVEKLNLSGWSWLPELQVKKSEDTGELIRSPDKYLDEVIAGRPVFSHPGLNGLGRRGGFRLRYGRARNTGLSAVGLNPATMILCDDFIAVGTQLKTERPGKGGIVAPVDWIEGPLVKLDDGSVVRVNTAEKARELKPRVREILYLGDMLVGYGEFLENNHPLMPAGYCEEWWAQEVKRALKSAGFDSDLSRFLEPPFPAPNPRLAVEISRKLKVPLHPAFTYFYEQLSIEELVDLARWLAKGEPKFEDGNLVQLRLPLEKSMKELLEEIGLPHAVEGSEIVVIEHAYPLCVTMGLLQGNGLSAERLEKCVHESSSGNVLEVLSKLAGFPVLRRGGTFIGARMGRPEKAKYREMRPPVHVLFPVGNAGGKMRNVVEAAKNGGGRVKVEVALLECDRCGAAIRTKLCSKCGGEGKYVKRCPKCHQILNTERCPTDRRPPRYYVEIELNVAEILERALDRLGEKMPVLVKGVKGMNSDFKIPEPLEKGILRAKHGVFVFKDGTIRFDATNAPLTHFRPKEIGVSVEKLRELGYTTDVYGKPLERADQLLELKVQDVVISDKCAEYLLRVSHFVDELLEKFYGMEPYYRCSSKHDLLGHLILALAPHTSVGMVGRIIGFTPASVCFAHPFFHAAKRRDCDGDEDCVMLLLDALLNFSKRFLPSSRGGRMDAPLLLSVCLNPSEIDKQAHNMDIMFEYPLEFYYSAEKHVHPTELEKLMETAGKRLSTDKEIKFGFTVDTSDISQGPLESRYKTLETMEEKVRSQLQLAERIRAVDADHVAELVIDHHFIRDLKGNIRIFSAQDIRCVNCNTKYRRIPLKGTCLQCGGKLVLTVHRGTVEKYLAIALRLAEEYRVSEYTKQRLMLLKRDIQSMFESDVSRQTSLADFLI